MTRAKDISIDAAIAVCILPPVVAFVLLLMSDNAWPMVIAACMAPWATPLAATWAEHAIFRWMTRSHLPRAEVRR